MYNIKVFFSADLYITYENVNELDKDEFVKNMAKKTFFNLSSGDAKCYSFYSEKVLFVETTKIQ